MAGRTRRTGSVLELEMIPEKRVLAVDNDTASRAKIAHSLREEAVDFVEARTARHAIAALKEERIDLLTTELHLPDMSGFALCRMIREEPILASVNVMMVTSHVDEMDRILAFEMGVDDFLPKPFYARELAARVRALLRRSTPNGKVVSDSRAKRYGDLALDADGRVVMVRERPVDLTPREFDLLAKLVREGGRVLSRKQLVEEVWGSDAAAGERAVDTHVKTIRRKLGDAKRYVETIRGVGYRFADDR